MAINFLFLEEKMYELFIELTIQLRKWGLHLLITTNKRLVLPVFLHHDSVINLLARKSLRPLLILPTVDHLCGQHQASERVPSSHYWPPAISFEPHVHKTNEKCFFEPLSICQNS
ncbi:hypothetical protein Bca4012_038559 [Brassica carinata]|uniref:Uncharacterized protein n=1 Tax=Brassica carinata TaxID=52824 RepID=A0A8X8B7M3_BRACI|nr:hypothetical protein Bca52824_006890 [Brassica carinata]